MVSINALFQFKNYLQIDFEILRPNLALCGIRLIGPCSYETIQWWTNDRVAQNSDSRLAGHEFLQPRSTLLTLPSPTVMTFLGVQYAFCGHRINALYLDLHDQRQSLLPDSDYIIKHLQLEIIFEDGSIELIPIIEDTANHFLQLSDEFTSIDLYVKNLFKSVRPVFLELGARGPRSELVRKRVGISFQYIGLDVSPGDNVDVVGDAHNLTELFDLDSVDIIYSDDVMEHLLNPFILVNQANQILKMGGLFIAKVPTTWPLHAEPWDYWRFSSHSWKGLLNSRSGYEILSTREIGSSSVVPSMIDQHISANTQYAPAPLFTVVLAKKIAISSNDGVNLDQKQSLGTYDHWSIGSRHLD
jgi:SAM-dependent methyltransferase